MKKFKSLFILICILLILFSMSACQKAYQPYDYDLGKYITLGEYKGISYQPIVLDVTDADVQTRINSEMKEHGYGEDFTITSGEVLYGDVVKMDYTGKIDGKEDKSLATKGYQLVVGSDTFLEDFEMGLIGKEIGKVNELTVLFPKEYIKTAYAGKSVVFTVTIHSAERKKFPELTDEIVSDISEYKTVNEYLDAIKNDLEKEALVEAEEAKAQAIWTTVVDNAKVIEYPQQALDYLIENSNKQFEETATASGLTLEAYLQQNQTTLAEYEVYAKELAQSYCKDEMVMHSIARKEGIEVTEQEIEALAQTYTKTYGYKSIKDLYKKHSKGLIEQTILYQKVKDFVVENAVESK